jgi:adenine-specific DNA-methyltransferase
MYDRISKGKWLLSKDFTQIIAIDEVEQEYLGQEITSIFPLNKKVCVSIVHNPRGQQGTNVSYMHEFAYFIYPDDTHKFLADIKRTEIDSRTLRDSGTESNREDAATCFYPFIIRNSKIVGVGKVPLDSFHPSSGNVDMKDGTIEIWPIDDNGIEKKWRYSIASVKDIMSKLEVKKGRNSLQIIFNKDTGTMKSLWDDSKYDASEYGTKELQKMFGADYVELNAKNLYPKSKYTEEDCILAGVCNKKDSIVLDYFGGSGTTAHAVIELNRQNVFTMKYILCEMGEYFDTVTKPRVEKVIYSEDWKDGKPISRKGSSHAFKYISLESYEDSLNNIEFTGESPKLTDQAKEEYVLSYMLKMQSNQSACLLNIDKLKNPFAYEMKITKNLETKTQTVDLVETFNYLIGLQIEHSYAKVSFDAAYTKGEKGVLVAKLVKWFNIYIQNDRRQTAFRR